jgi:hypothetical protein
MPVAALVACICHEYWVHWFQLGFGGRGHWHWMVRFEDVLREAIFYIWIISPYAFAIAMTLLQRKTLAPSLTMFVGSLLISGFGCSVLFWSMLCLEGEGVFFTLAALPFIQWSVFLITVAIAYLVAARPFRWHAVPMLVAAMIFSAAVWLNLAATYHPDKYEKYAIMLSYYPWLLGALDAAVLTFLVVRDRPRIKKAET